MTETFDFQYYFSSPAFLAFQMECFGFDWSRTWCMSTPVLSHLHQLGRKATRELLIFVLLKSLRRRIYTLLSLYRNNFIFPKWFPIFSIPQTHLIQGKSVEGKLNNACLSPSQWNLKIKSQHLQCTALLRSSLRRETTVKYWWYYRLQ